MNLGSQGKMARQAVMLNVSRVRQSRKGELEKLILRNIGKFPEELKRNTKIKGELETKKNIRSATARTLYIVKSALKKRPLDVNRE